MSVLNPLHVANIQKQFSTLRTTSISLEHHTSITLSLRETLNYFLSKLKKKTPQNEETKIDFMLKNRRLRIQNMHIFFFL